jgi:hypothetical protein
MSVTLRRFCDLFQVLNQVVIWDKIIKSKSGAKIKEFNEFVKYPLKDQGSELRFVVSN